MCYNYISNIIFYSVSRAGGTAPATPAMAGPKFCESARKLSARAKYNVSHQELTISYQRDLKLKTLTILKWINPIAVSNHFRNWLIFKRAAGTTKLRGRLRHFADEL